jgi:glycosyltransferase involved in cell wall biosynthesis
MTFAYLILAHKNPSQLLRLVNALKTDEVYFFIHVDGKVDETPFKFIINGDNIFFCECRKIVNWGGFSVTEAIMELIREMIVKIGFPDYVHLMSGQDFPLKSNEYVFNYFEKHKGTNFIEYFSLPSAIWNDGTERIKYNWYVDDLGYKKAAELVRIQNPRDFIPDIIPYGGATWWSLTGECVSHIFSECNRGGKLYEYYRYTVLSDEMLFHTFLMNSKYKDSIVNYNLRKIDWNAKGTHPKLWKIEDIEELTSSPRLFARKFDENIDSEILDKLEMHTAGNCNYAKKSQMQTVSVVMSMYNASEFLRECIDSILNQSFPDFELVIADDGSTDNSVEIVKSYKDRRIKLVLCKHDYINSLNTAISHAKGKYIARMDADDIMPVDRLEIQFEFMEKNPKIDVSTGWMQCFGSSKYLAKVPADHDKIVNGLINKCFMMHPTAMFKRALFKRKNMQYEQNYPSAEDYKLWIDMIKSGFRFSGIQRTLNYYRTHSNQIIVYKFDKMMTTSEKIQLEYIEYLMEKMVEENEKYFNLLDCLVNAANEDLIDSDSLINMVGCIHRDFLFRDNQQKTAKANKSRYTSIKNYLTQNYKDILDKYGYVKNERSRDMNIDESPVWICWWDGEKAMPDIVKACYKSACDNAGTHPVKLITRDNYRDFISVPDYIIDKVNKGMISITHLSDILRMCLLHDYGGLWIDSTILVTAELQPFLFEQDLFTLKNSSAISFDMTKYGWTTFLIGGRKENIFFAFMRDILLEYWRKETTIIHYFLMDYCISVGCYKIPVIRNMLKKIPCSNLQVFSMSRCLNKEFDCTVYHQICSDTNFHKLTWKKSFFSIINEKKTFYGYILSNYK